MGSHDTEHTAINNNQHKWRMQLCHSTKIQNRMETKQGESMIIRVWSINIMELLYYFIILIILIFSSELLSINRLMPLFIHWMKTAITNTDQHQSSDSCVVSLSIYLLAFSGEMTLNSTVSTRKHKFIYGNNLSAFIHTALWASIFCVHFQYEGVVSVAMMISSDLYDHHWRHTSYVFPYNILIIIDAFPINQSECATSINNSIKLYVFVIERSNMIVDCVTLKWINKQYVMATSANTLLIITQR